MFMRRTLLLTPLIPLIGTCVAAFAVVVPACNARIVDVGLNDAESVPSASTIPDTGLAASAYGCAEWIDEELYALRDGGCGGSCETVPQDPYGLDSKQEVMAATAGQWLYCSGTLGPGSAIGIEFAPGCRLYFLRRDADGNLVRGTERAYQAKYDIFHPRPANTAARIDVHLDEAQTLTFDVTADRCPERVRLVTRGMPAIDLARSVAQPTDPTR